MSSRRILNITSVKKQDNMATWRPADDTNPAGTGALQDLAMQATQGVVVNLFCPNARPMDSDGVYKDEPQARTKSATYARGYKEVTTYRVTGGIPWRHRRIVFTMKGLPALLLSATAPLVGNFTPDFYYLTTSLGIVRQTNVLDNSKVQTLTNLIFRGAQAADWFSPFNAKTDTTRISVVSDKTVHFNPGNSNGQVKLMKRWIPLNKRLVYGDDEQNASLNTTPFSTQGKQGMGDVFIVDFYQSTATDSAQGLSVNHEGTYYWHEK